MHVTEVVDHLVLPREAILATAVATLVAAVDELEVRSVVDDSDVPLQVSVPREPGASAGALQV